MSSDRKPFSKKAAIIPLLKSRYEKAVKMKATIVALNNQEHYGTLDSLIRIKEMKTELS